MTPSARRLAELELTGCRAFLRHLAMCAIALPAPVVAVAFVLGTSGALVSLLVIPAAMGLLVLAGRSSSRPYPRGIHVGLAAMLFAGVTIALYEVSATRWSEVTVVVALGSVLLFAVGLALAIFEPYAYRAERARLRRDVDPVFPVARVVVR